MEDSSAPKKLDFAQLRSKFEDTESKPPSKQARQNAPVAANKSCWARVTRFWYSKWPGWPGFWRCRFSGWPVALIFALYVYYLLVYVLLPTTVEVELKEPRNRSAINATLVSQIKQGIEDIDLNCANPSSKIRNQTKEINQEAIDALQWKNQKIGMYSAGATFVVFASGSYASTYVRCYMLLTIPGLFVGRGRALLMTISVVLLLDGPIANLNTNIQAVTQSFICMYEHMKVLACRYMESYSAVFEKLISTLERIHKDTKQRLTEIAKNANKLTGRAQREARRIKKETEQTLRNVANGIDRVRHEVENAENETCNDRQPRGWLFWFFPFFRKPHNIRHCNRMRSLKRMMPDVSVNAPEMNLEELVAWARKLHPNMNPLKVNKNNVGDLLQGQSTATIREKLMTSTQHFFDILTTVFSHIKVGFYVLSLLYMLYHANSYLVKYLSDDAFDNMYVNGTLDEGFTEKLLPLRNWERKEKYQLTATKKCMKLSSKEYKRIGLLVVIPLLFCIFTIAIIAGDQFFASFIDIMKEHGKFGITFTGMDYGIELNGLLNEVEKGTIPMLDLQLEAFDLSTDPCLPVPIWTDWKKLIPLISLVIISLLTCFMDAYLQRLRSQFCNLFYPERAQNRIAYLRKKIKTGRGKRFYQLKLVATQRKRKHDRLLENSYWYQFKCWFNHSVWNSSEIMCNGCDKEVKKKSLHVMNFDNTTCFICADCMKDVA